MCDDLQVAMMLNRSETNINFNRAIANRKSDNEYCHYLILFNLDFNQSSDTRHRKALKWSEFIL